MNVPLFEFSRTGWAIVSAAFLEMVLLRPIPKKTSLVVRGLGALGLVSYSFYLIHQPILDKFVGWCRGSYGISIVVQLSAAIVILLPMLLVLSSLLYLLVERGGVALGRKLQIWWCSNNEAGPDVPATTQIMLGREAVFPQLEASR